MNISTGTVASNFLEVSPRICLSDFDMSKPSGHVINIFADMRYEEKWKRIAENANNYKKWSNK